MRTQHTYIYMNRPLSMAWALAQFLSQLCYSVQLFGRARPVIVIVSVFICVCVCMKGLKMMSVVAAAAAAI